MRRVVVGLTGEPLHDPVKRIANVLEPVGLFEPFQVVGFAARFAHAGLPKFGIEIHVDQPARASIIVSASGQENVGQENGSSSYFPVLHFPVRWA